MRKTLAHVKNNPYFCGIELIKQLSDLKHRENGKSFRYVYSYAICDFRRGVGYCRRALGKSIIYSFRALVTRDYCNGKSYLI